VPLFKQVSARVDSFDQVLTLAGFCTEYKHASGPGMHRAQAGGTDMPGKDGVHRA